MASETGLTGVMDYVTLFVLHVLTPAHSLVLSPLCLLSCPLPPLFAPPPLICWPLSTGHCQQPDCDWHADEHM